MENFIGALMLLVISGPLYFLGCNKLFKWWDKRKKKNGELNE